MAKEPEILQAIRFICEEKGLAPETVISTIEAALAAAYRKDFGEMNQNVIVKMDTDTGQYRAYDHKIVVEDLTEEEIEAQKEEYKAYKEAVREAREAEQEEPAEPEKTFYNPKLHLMISEAKDHKKDAEIGDELMIDLQIPADFGRMAAQTAKQVVMQKLREAERSHIFDEFKDREGEVVIGSVQRKEGRNVLVDIGKAVAIMPPDQQVRGEGYATGQRIKVYIHAVNMGNRGPQIVVSRAHANIVKQLFTMEIPEIANDVIEIKSISREAGARSKVAVYTEDESIDPIGSCVGQRGTRVQTIINELGGEKVDIIEWDEDPIVFISNALSPAEVTSIELKEESREANVYVAQDQLSLAIGRGGQNVRLASQLTGWTINVELAEGAESAESKEDSEDNSSEENMSDISDDKKEEMNMSETEESVSEETQEEASLKENTSEEVSKEAEDKE